MTRLRRLLLDHRALAAWIVVVALLMRVLVPAGYMLGGTAGAMSLTPCSGYGAMPMPMPMPMPTTHAMPGMTHHGDQPGHDGKEVPCPFAGLTAASLVAADPLLLAAAIAFVLAAPFRSETPSAARGPAFLRPPLRGPPTLG